MNAYLNRQRLGSATLMLWLLTMPTLSMGNTPAQTGIESSELQTRRQHAMNAVPDGIILLHSFSKPKSWIESGFQQDPNFQYFTGLENLHAAILALDGTTGESWLFVQVPTPKQQDRFAELGGRDVAYLAPSHEAEQDLKIDHIASWDGFAGFIEARLKSRPKTVLYLDAGGPAAMQAAVSNPTGFMPIENPYLLWAAAIKARWPDASIGDATPVLQDVRLIKSPAEIALLRKASELTVAGLWSAAGAVAPGHTEHQVEAAAIDGAMGAGADGLGMWPTLLTGPDPDNIYAKFYDSDGTDRTLQAGQVLRVNMAFDYQGYKGDIGRTFPVSGKFTPEQSEVLDLMNGAYQACLQALHDGTTPDAVIQAGIHYVEDHKSALRSDLARKAATKLVTMNPWILYSHGLEMVDKFPLQTLKSGYVLGFGPDVDVDGQVFYVEDTLLVTKDGYELINPPLPYSPADIEKTVERYRHVPQDASSTGI